MAGALSHIRVLDLSRVLAGPWAAQNLGDLGADVIKIERPGCGDDTRAWGPPFFTSADGSRHDSGYFASVNRNKRSMTIDLASTAGQDLVREMAKEADVLIAQTGEGYEPFHAVYRRETCLPAIEAAIHEDKWKVTSWFSEVKLRKLMPDELKAFDPSVLCFWNVNTPEEFANAEKLAQSE